MRAAGRARALQNTRVFRDECDADAATQTRLAEGRTRRCALLNLARENRALGFRITPQFSRGTPTHVPWHFMPDRRLQLLVRRLAHRLVMRAHCDKLHGERRKPFAPAWCSAT